MGRGASLPRSRHQRRSMGLPGPPEHAGDGAPAQRATNVPATRLPTPRSSLIADSESTATDTVLERTEELTVDVVVPRERADRTEAVLAGEEGARTLGPVWRGCAQRRSGGRAGGRAPREKPLPEPSPLQLYAEQIHPPPGRHL